MKMFQGARIKCAFVYSLDDEIIARVQNGKPFLSYDRYTSSLSATVPEYLSWWGQTKSKAQL